MKTFHPFHPVIIECPKCKIIQAAIIEHTTPFGTYIHHCIKCEYIIMESDWNEIKPFISLSNLEAHSRTWDAAESWCIYERTGFVEVPNKQTYLNSLSLPSETKQGEDG